MSLEFQNMEWDTFRSEANGFRRANNPADVGRNSVFGRISRTSPEYKTGNWQNGAGFSKMGLAGSRRVPLPSFSSTNRFGAANPTCGTCGGRLRGKKKCLCEQPNWKPIGKRRNVENEGLPDDVTGGGYGSHLKQFEAWCVAWLTECHRVLVPGGVIKVFGATRTFHRMARAMELAGFRIEGMEAWMYSTGFPKSLNVAAALEAQGEDHAPFEGYGTQLKPSWEPFVVGRKP